MRLFPRTPVSASVPALPPTPGWPPDGQRPGPDRAAGRPTTAWRSDPPTVVALIGSPPLAVALAPYLPAGHRVDAVERLDDVTEADALVLSRATAGSVTAALRRRPGIPVIALIEPSAPVETLIGVLEAGADTCVRTGETVLLAGHLLACLRRHRLSRSQVAPSSRPGPSQPTRTALPA